MMDNLFLYIIIIRIISVIMHSLNASQWTTCVFGANYLPNENNSRYALYNRKSSSQVHPNEPFVYRWRATTNITLPLD